MSWLRETFQYVVRLVRRTPHPLRTLVVEELPQDLRTGTIYVIGEEGHIWSVALLCPCGCGETIHLNVLPETRPRWRVKSHRDGRVSLTPSVWRTTGCRSHFFVREGVVDWVPKDRARYGCGTAD